MHVDQMSPDWEGAPLEDCANRIGHEEPRLEVGVWEGWASTKGPRTN